MQHKSLFAALLCGALCLTACLKNEESPSVTQVRNAKASELESIATLNKATAEATVIQANAQAKLAEAEAKVKEAEAKLREADAAYRLAEADGVKAATALKLVEVQLKEVEVELARVNVDIKKEELKAKQAELEALKAEYQARIAAAEAAKLYYDNLKQVINAELEVALTNTQAALIDAQLEVIKSQTKYAEYLKQLEEAAEAEELAKFEAMRDSVISLSAKYHGALRDLIDMEAKLSRKQFRAAKLQAGLEDAISVKNAEIAENEREIERYKMYIQAVENYRAEFLGYSTDDLKDLAAELYEQVYVAWGLYEESYAIFEDAYDAYEDAYSAFAHNYPILTKEDDGIEDANYIESGIVYDYTDALLTPDPITGANLQNIGVDYNVYDFENSTYSRNWTNFIEKDLDLKDEWHSLNMRVYTKKAAKEPDTDGILDTYEMKEYELYRYYQHGNMPVGVEVELVPERYPELEEGIAEDRYEWEGYEYITLEHIKFHPITVNKEGYDAYIALEREALDSEYALATKSLEGMKYFADWYVETYNAAVEGVKKAIQDSWGAYEDAYDEYIESYKDYIEAYDAWIKARKIDFETSAKEMEILTALEDALYEMGDFIYDNEEQVAEWKQALAEKENEIEGKKSQIENLKAQKENPDTDSPEYQDYMEKKAAYEAAVAEYEAAVKAAKDASDAYDAYSEKVDGFSQAYLTAYEAWWNAKRDAEADPEDAEKQALAAEKEAAMTEAYQTYVDAKTLLNGPDEDLAEGESFLTTKEKAEEAQVEKETAMNFAKAACEEAKAAVGQAIDQQIETLQGEIDALQAEIDDINSDEKLGGYEKKLAEKGAAIDKLEEEWADLARNNEEWKAVVAAKEKVYGEEGTIVKVGEAYDDYYELLGMIYTPRYFNDSWSYKEYDTYKEYFQDWDEIAWYDIYDIWPYYSYWFWSDDVLSWAEEFADWYSTYLYNGASKWDFIVTFYDNTLPMSMWDMVDLYNYFTQDVFFPAEYAEQSEYLEQAYSYAKEQIDNLQARLDKVMAGEEVYFAGIETENELSEALLEAEKNAWEAENAELDAYYTYLYVEYAWENIYEEAYYGETADLDEEIAYYQEQIAELEKENDDWDDIFDDTLALTKLQANIAVLESEIEIQEVIVASWKAQLDAALAELMDDMGIEEPAAE